MKQEEQVMKELQQAEEKERQRRAQYEASKENTKSMRRQFEDWHKYMTGGTVHKYFPQSYEFSEAEMNEIIACALAEEKPKNMIRKMLERKKAEKNEKEGKTKERKTKTGDNKPAEQNGNSMDAGQTEQPNMIAEPNGDRNG